MDTQLPILTCGNGNGNGTKEPRASRLGIHVLISGGPHIACDIIFYAHFSVVSHSAAICVRPLRLLRCVVHNLPRANSQRERVSAVRRREWAALE